MKTRRHTPKGKRKVYLNEPQPTNPNPIPNPIVNPNPVRPPLTSLQDADLLLNERCYCYIKSKESFPFHLLPFAVRVVANPKKKHPHFTVIPSSA